MLVRGHHSISRGGGGRAEFFVANKTFILTRFGDALKISNCITCLYRAVFGVNYLFHTESVRVYFNSKKNTPALRLMKIEWSPAKYIQHVVDRSSFERISL